jgi:hypothetical protein
LVGCIRVVPKFCLESVCKGYFGLLVSVTENQGSAKLFCFGAIHQLTQLEALHCFGEHYQGVLNDPKGDAHQNIRNFIIYGWEGLKFLL